MGKVIKTYISKPHRSNVCSSLTQEANQPNENDGEHCATNSDRACAQLGCGDRRRRWKGGDREFSLVLPLAWSSRLLEPVDLSRTGVDPALEALESKPQDNQGPAKRASSLKLTDHRHG
jgi:hypothetical protein